MTDPQPDPQVVAWMRDYLKERPHVDPIEICDRYRATHPDSDWSYAFLTDCYVKAHEPLTPADVPGGQGPASLYLVRDERGFPAVFYRDENGHPRPLRVEPAFYPPGVDALWEHLAATLPTVTTEETP